MMLDKHIDIGIPDTLDKHVICLIVRLEKHQGFYLKN